MTKPAILNSGEALLLVIDVQEAFKKAISDFHQVEKGISLVIKAFKIIQQPIVVSEQNPSKLGLTVESLRKVLGESYRPFPKMSFSLLRDPAIRENIKSSQRRSLLLAGIETHVCVLQTALDALEEGFKVFILADCVSSRFTYLKELALRRMERAGAVITSAEVSLFELLKTAEAPFFKSVQALIKDYSRELNFE